MLHLRWPCERMRRLLSAIGPIDGSESRHVLAKRDVVSTESCTGYCDRSVHSEDVHAKKTARGSVGTLLYGRMTLTLGQEDFAELRTDEPSAGSSRGTLIGFCADSAPTKLCG